MSKRSGIQLFYPFEERRLYEPKFGWTWPVIVQAKLDGERCRAVMTSAGYKLLSSTCNEIISVPHINKFASSSFNHLPFGELDGELYLHGKTFEEIHSIVSRTTNMHELSETMEYHIFDYISDEPQLKRTTKLSELSIPEDSPIKIVPSFVAHNMEELMEIYKKLIDTGYEGIIIRHMRAGYARKRSRFGMKFKPKKDDFYKIMEPLQAFSTHGTPLGMLGALRCCGSDDTLFKIGAGRLTHEERRELWKDRHLLPDKYAHVQYQNITSGGVPRFGLCMEIVEKNPEEIESEGIL